ncbi:hypothetical protein MNEG_10735, partial [Monoraphidium neglectum]
MATSAVQGCTIGTLLDEETTGEQQVADKEAELRDTNELNKGRLLQQDLAAVQQQPAALQQEELPQAQPL